jgi:hypothetical protein
VGFFARQSNRKGARSWRSGDNPCPGNLIPNSVSVFSNFGRFSQTLKLGNRVSARMCRPILPSSGRSGVPAVTPVGQSSSARRACQTRGGSYRTQKPRFPSGDKTSYFGPSFRHPSVLALISTVLSVGWPVLRWQIVGGRSWGADVTVNKKDLHRLADAAARTSSRGQGRPMFLGSPSCAHGSGRDVGCLRRSAPAFWSGFACSVDGLRDQTVRPPA